jgi:hypothetical protein
MFPPNRDPLGCGVAYGEWRREVRTSSLVKGDGECDAPGRRPWVGMRSPKTSKVDAGVASRRQRPSGCASAVDLSPGPGASVLCEQQGGTPRAHRPTAVRRGGTLRPIR